MHICNLTRLVWFMNGASSTLHMAWLKFYLREKSLISEKIFFIDRYQSRVGGLLVVIKVCKLIFVDKKSNMCGCVGVY